MLVFFHRTQILQFGFQTDWFTMSQLPRYRFSLLPWPLKRKRPPLPLLPLPAWEMPPTSGRLTSEILDEQGMDPPTRQMSQLHIRDIAPPDPPRRKKMPGRPTQVTQRASIPTWGQIKTLSPSTGDSFFTGIFNLPWESVYCYARPTILPGRRLLPHSRKLLGIFPWSSNFSYSHVE